VRPKIGHRKGNHSGRHCGRKSEVNKTCKQPICILALQGSWGAHHIAMQVVSLRIVPFIDSQSLEAREGREVLLRDSSGFHLYLTDGDPTSAAEERIISLELREALIWLNEAREDQGSFWS
jgi:hypothetical protein